MREIQGKTKSIRELLKGTRYTIDYYQRQYRWQTKQVRELLDDLAESFLQDYQVQHERREVQRYGHYFLGSIIISDKEGQRFIIDGQQRLTTLTVLLIYLYHTQESSNDRVSLDDLIYSERYGEQSFNIDVEERTPALRALFHQEPFDSGGQNESVRNIVERYSDIANLFPDSLKERALPYFADWLIENVHIVEITAYSDEDAYTIFETMNDRGLSLTPLDMLKGYLLANITDTPARNAASATWQSRIEQLGKLGKEEDADAFKSWLRGQHAQTIRERRRGASPRDFDRIGTEFHRWIRDNEDALRLHTSSDFARFIQHEMAFYSRQYQRLREAANTLTGGLEHVFYNAQFAFTLQYPFLLAGLTPDDTEDTIIRKLRICAMYVDIVLTRRLWNWRAIDYSTMQYRMFTEIRDVRGKSVQEMASILRGKLNADPETFAGNERFGLHQRNRYIVHRILARITDYIERQSGMPSRYAEYIAEGRNKYEVEHVWADKYERHTDEFAHPQDFAQYRNRIGGLLLLPKSFNASYGALTYEKKLKHYYGQNLLAKSLNPATYEHNPGFCRYIERSGLPFRPHPHLQMADMDERQALYGRIAEEIWNPELLTKEAQA